MKSSQPPQAESGIEKVSGQGFTCIPVWNLMLIPVLLMFCMGFFYQSSVMQGYGGPVCTASDFHHQ